MRNKLSRENIREAILDATDRMLARYGYKKMTIEDLAREIGIGKGTIYLYFNSKEDITLSHIDRIVARLNDQLQFIASSDESVTERLRAMLIMRVMFCIDSVQHYTQSLNDLLVALRPAFLARRERYFEAEAAIFTEILKEGRQLEVLIFDEPAQTAHTLLLATNSLLPYSLSLSELGAREEIKAQVSQIADLLIRGLQQPVATHFGKQKKNSATFYIEID